MSESQPQSLLERTAKSAGWIVAWRMLNRTLGLISTLILVRLLLPSDFGLVALSLSFGQAIDTLSALGLEEAVIREKAPTRELYDSAFTINVLRGCLTSTLIALGAVPVAHFFGDARMTPIMLIFSGGALIGSFENIAIVDFRRDLLFEKEFLLMAVPRLIGVVLAITTAFLLHTYWALVIAMSSGSIIRVTMTYLMHPFRPRLGLRAWRQIAGFSAWSWGTSLSGLVRDRCDTFVIGRVLDITHVGVFSLGLEIAGLPATELISPLARACFSSFAATRRSGSTADTTATLLRIIGTASLIALPAGVGLSLVADPVVHLAFGNRWLEATPLVQILGVGLCVMIPGLICASLLNAYAVLRPQIAIQLLCSVVRITVMVILVDRLGILGAGIATVCGVATEHLSYIGLVLHRLRLPIRAIIQPMARSLIATAVMAGALAASGLGWAAVGSTGSAVRDLLEAVPAGVVVYTAASAAVWFAAGTPDGAEQDFLRLARRSGGHALRVIAAQIGLAA